VPYKLLTCFESLFRGQPYLHRNSTLGDQVASYFYEDLHEIKRSAHFNEHVDSGRWVVNARNNAQGIQSRRGDGTFGELVPSQGSSPAQNYAVQRGPVTSVEIGVEVKILHKAMIKQIDRVIGDLRKQVGEFKQSNPDAISLAIVGINHAAYTVGYEGLRLYKTDGRANRHPISEAADAENRILAKARPSYDELLILRYIATNETPFDFAWLDVKDTEANYSAAMLRIARHYDSRFPYLI
jgi:hypothetical protein